jgi:hypothetical protein
MSEGADEEIRGFGEVLVNPEEAVGTVSIMGVMLSAADAAGRYIKNTDSKIERMLILPVNYFMTTPPPVLWFDGMISVYGIDNRYQLFILMT